MNNRIREIRKENGLTQDEFAEIIGSHKNNLCQMERGNRNITNRTVKLIAKSFGINEEWILTGEGEKYVTYEKEKEIGQLMADLRKVRLMEYINRMDDETFERFASIVEHMAESVKE